MRLLLSQNCPQYCSYKVREIERHRFAPDAEARSSDRPTHAMEIHQGGPGGRAIACRRILHHRSITQEHAQGERTRSHTSSSSG